IPSRWVLRLYNARPLLPSAAPALSGLTRELARRAGLERVPVLYWIPSRTVNAFSVGSRDDAALALTDGLLRLLSPRELAGVLAHEISHVSNNDMRLMGLADMISRPTHLMSVLGLLLMLLSLPLMMFGMAMFPLSGMLLLLAAPGISALLQLGLSRVREFDADLEAARITGDPRGLASALAKATGAVLGQLPAGANSVGAQLVGAVGDGLDAMLAQPAKGYLLMGVEPGYDLWDPAAANAALTQSGFVVALSGFRSESLEAVADVILPVSAFAETSGTFVNAEGTWQSFAGAVSPKGETRPAWKVLRVLGNLLDLQGFDHDSSEEVLAEARQQAEGRQLDNAPADAVTECRLVDAALTRIGDVPIYAVDALVRHAAPLQKTRDAIAAAIYINESEAAKAGLTAGMQAAVTQNGTRVILPVTIDPNIPNGCVRIPAGVAGTEQLGGQFGEVTLEKA
ncbi:MAG: hypothetical protein B0D87_05510, partial [Candidatus Sedimenticola endophacoides]